MFSLPLKWNKQMYGGYLTNKYFKHSLISRRTDNKHLTNNKKSLYEAVNYLNSIKFGINNLLLNYLLNEGKYILDSAILKNDLQKEITLKLAEIIGDTPFYLTCHADWRGRLYTESFFLTYQGYDLSNSLVNYWEGQSLSESGKYYFYIHGANCHNYDGISKKSFIDRINWVKTNYDKIINLDRELILDAKNIFSFTSFCLNMREINRDGKWIVKSAVFLDATCSGIQHLAAMLKDVELGAQVNLNKSSEHDVPSDIYSYLLNYINDNIHKHGEKDEFSHFKFIQLTRDIVKNPIMTKVYNVSITGVFEQLATNFKKVPVKFYLIRKING